MADIEIITNVSGLDEMETTLNAGGKRAAVKLQTATEKTAAKVLAASTENFTRLIRDS